MTLESYPLLHDVLRCPRGPTASNISQFSNNVMARCLIAIHLPQDAFFPIAVWEGTAKQRQKFCQESRMRSMEKHQALAQTVCSHALRWDSTACKPAPRTLGYCSQRRPFWDEWLFCCSEEVPDHQLGQQERHKVFSFHKEGKTRCWEVMWKIVQIRSITKT